MMLLMSDRVEVAPDAFGFAQFAAERGWGDGLPLVHPTVELVEAYVLASGASADLVVGQIPPHNADCTVERLAINAVMAGAPADAMPLLMAAVTAITKRDFGLHPMNATSAPVVPALILNGSIRHELKISCGAGCVGGADGPNLAIGRALRLVIRNVGGQRVGKTCETCFGQPARVTGIVIGEWEEKSPWPPLGERRGVSGNSVTALSTNGTMNIVDNTSETADLLLDRIGRSLAYPGSNGFRPHAEFATVGVGINPIWAEIIGKAYPNIADVQKRLWDFASFPIESWPKEHQILLEEAGMVAPDGRVPLVKDPDRLLIMVCGGLTGHHALALHGFSSCVPSTVGFGKREM
ncbi:hypothetical protein [Paraburkholderia sp. RL17-347-BIC-D]|uniref:hypothetical protein n=1 Tax=Paraburkholderia sp. RL17-347-BIC-D TaxID=3031632 RepID=UPI0038B86921